MNVWPNAWPANYWAHWGVFAVIIIVFLLLLVLGFIWYERRILALFQIRLGPNRAGPFGLLQPVADAIKTLLKEDIIPASGDKWVHLLAPIVAFFPVLMVLVVLPLHPRQGLVPWLDIGIIYVVAISSLSAIGVFMAGWSSNNKYSLFGAMRMVAQVVSYEIPLVLSVLGVVLLSGTLSLSGIVAAQSGAQGGLPFILLQPLGFLIFFIASIAEINRCPFDLMEADSELVAGFHTEYSGAKFALFFLAEYGEAVVMSALVTTLFLGGWTGPASLQIGALWFIIKAFIVFFVVVWIRSTLPRLRVDQVMGFSWKGLLPLAMINLLITAVEVAVWQTPPAWIIAVNLVIAGALILVWSKFFKLGGGRVEVREIWHRNS